VVNDEFRGASGSGSSRPIRFDTATRDERGSDIERRDERRKHDVVTGTSAVAFAPGWFSLLSSLISRSGYLSSLVAVLKPPSARQHSGLLGRSLV
jgi:hypothetical protein